MDSEIQWAALESTKTLIEQAKEELELLEYQHPNKFHCLKMELRDFISGLEEQSLLLNNTTSMPTCPSAATQESSSRKKRKECKETADIVEVKFGSVKRRCKTEAVLERAQECLHKIHNFKTSLY